MAIFIGTPFESERDRWPLWLPVMLGAGCGLYFALSFEPAPVWGWAAPALGLALAAAAIAGWARWPLALALGFGAAKLNEMRLATPVLGAPVITHLTGRVVSLEPRGKVMRAVMDQVRSGGLQPVPRRVRVSFRGLQDFHPGDWLSLTARLDTPPAPSEPGASDWAAVCSSSPSARWILPMVGRIRCWLPSRRVFGKERARRSKLCGWR